MANGGLNGSMVDMASRVIVQVGFPVVVAGVLLWFLLTKFQDNMLVITDRMAKNTQAADSLVQHQAALVEQEKIIYGELKFQTESLRTQSVLMKQIADDAHKLADIRNQELDLFKTWKGSP